MVQRRRRLLEHPHGAQVRAVDLNLHAGPLPIHSGAKLMTFPRLMLTQSRASRYGRKVSTMRRSSAGVFGRCNSKRSGTLARQHGVPQANGGIARRRVDQHGAEEALPVGEEERGDTEAACIDDSLVFGEYLLACARVGDGLVDQARVEPELFEERPRHVRYVGLWPPRGGRPARAYQASSSAMSRRRSSAPTRIMDQP